LIPATAEYLRIARELTDQYGAVLIFDEVITGFCFRAGNIGALYGIQTPNMARPQVEYYNLTVKTSGISARNLVELCAPWRITISEEGNWSRPGASPSRWLSCIQPIRWGKESWDLLKGK